MTNPKMLAATLALTGKAVTSEDEAATELTALAPEVVRLRAIGAAVAKGLGVELDADKITAKITELSTSVATHQQAAKEAKALSIKTSIEAFLVKNEKRIGSVPLRAMFSRNLTAELETAPDAKVEETETGKAIASLPETGTTTQSTGADVGDGNTPDDEKLDAAAKALMSSDAEVKALTERSGFATGFSLALEKAAKSLNYKPRLTT